MKPSTTFILLLATALSWPTSQVAAGEAPKNGPTMSILKTKEGVRFGLFGVKKEAPAPTLFVFASGLEDMQRQLYFTEVGRLLAKQGFLYVALDPPCHGADVKPGEPPQLGGWRARVEKGEPFIATFTQQASLVLDHLVKEKYTDPSKVAACGISRGGFLAMHFTAAEPRIKAAVGFAPVTNLLALTEFTGLEKNEAAKSLALINVAPKLAGRPVWISIGNNDERVSTDDAIAFTRRLVVASKGKGPTIPVEITVGASVGHTDLAGSHARAAAWILQQLTPSK